MDVIKSDVESFATRIIFGYDEIFEQFFTQMHPKVENFWHDLIDVIIPEPESASKTMPTFYSMCLSLKTCKSLYFLLRDHKDKLDESKVTVSKILEMGL